MQTVGARCFTACVICSTISTSRTRRSYRLSYRTNSRGLAFFHGRSSRHSQKLCLRNIRRFRSRGAIEFHQMPWAYTAGIPGSPACIGREERDAQDRNREITPVRRRVPHRSRQILSRSSGRNGKRPSGMEELPDTRHMFSRHARNHVEQFFKTKHFAAPPAAHSHVAASSSVYRTGIVSGRGTKGGYAGKD